MAIIRAETTRSALALGIAVFLAAFLSIREVPSAEERTLAAYPSEVIGVPDVLVAVSRGVEGAVVSVTGPFSLLGGSGEPITNENRNLDGARVRPSGGGLAVGGQTLGRHTRLEFRPSPGEEVWLDGVPLPGSAVLTRDGYGAEMTAAVLIDVEGYTCAALAHRADWRRWSDEALAAHAIVIRTRALYERTIARSAGARWDLFEPRLLGALRDGSSRSPRVAKAVNRTRGLVLSWDRKLFPACLTSSCGGCTEDSANVFTADSVMPLGGVKCPFCLRIEHPNAQWRVRLFASDITERLRPYVEVEGSKLGSVRRIETVVRGTSRRAVALRVETAFGPFDVDAGVFRTAVGIELLPSALFTIEEVGPELMEFVGRGEGPGVGLCQYGAEQMSLEGQSCIDIVTYYYPGATVARLPYRSRTGFADKYRQLRRSQ